MKPFGLILTCIISLIFISKSTTAADVKKIKYLLIQINTQTNKIEALNKAHYSDKAMEAQKDAIGVRTAIKNDFKDNFSYCKVYYFNDTDADKIKNKEFTNALRDGDGNLIANPEISNNDTNYLIAYWGYPLSQTRYRETVTDTSTYTANSDAPYGQGLVLLNYKFLQKDYIYNFQYDEYGIKLFHRKLLKYCYFSKHFDIEYFVSAKNLENLILKSDNVKYRNRMY